ncbi:MAG: YesL family protein [Fusicatenibacter sp.]
MGNLLRVDGKVYEGVAKLGNLVILNIVFLICCVPIATIGASVTALYTVTLKMAEDKETYVIRSYFRAWKENWKQSTIIWIGMLSTLLILILDMNLCAHLDGPLIPALSILVRIFLLIWAMISTYVYPVLAKFQNTVSGTIKNAFIMSGVHLLTTAVTVGLNCLPLVFLFFSYDHLVLIIGIYTWVGLAAIAYLNSSLFNRIFHKYEVKETE